ncbi:MAG: glycosyltransferase, partial [Flavobacteriales bacterium]
MKSRHSKIKVLFVSNGLGKGGKERQIHEILSHLNDHQEFECALLLRKPEVAYTIEQLDNIRFFIPTHALNANQFVRFLGEGCSSFRPDVIHTWESWVTNMSHIYRFTRLKKIKVIDGSLRYAKSFKKNGVPYWSARIGRILSHRVIANSSAGLDSIDYARQGKYSVVTNAMNAQRLHVPIQPEKTDKPFTITMVASFTPAKDYATLITTVSEMLLEGYDIVCNLVGDGKMRTEMMELVPSNQRDRFHFTGLIADPERILNHSHVGVLLARKGHSEGYSNTIMEIIAAGLPVICTNTGGNPEMVTPNKNGFLIGHESKEELRSVI